MKRRVWAVLLGLLSALAARDGGAAPAGGQLDYNRQIRPILSDKCFKCHGPDAGGRQAGLRLDRRDEALRPAESGERAIVPGKSAESELVRRIFSGDDDERMPPADEKKQLGDAEKELLKQWIDQGAPYQAHWAFVAPRRPSLPAVKAAAWPRNPVDYFLLARLEREGLQPSPEASRAALLRRLTLDLTGLPPTPAEIDAFVADARPDAYERQVDRLLASPRYGERLALDWLDAARFADTHGYHIDSGRDMSRWREWVIASFNRNQPFDQFTIEQLAGDLLPEATLEQRIASGFHRNHMINFEGGAIPEEYHNAYVVDRVNTTGTVWLGMSVACTQCHDHKYDPLTQREFYQLYAFFYNVPENGLDGNRGNAAPLVRAPAAGEQRELDRLAAQIVQSRTELAAPWPDVDRAQLEWESAAAAAAVVWQPLVPRELSARGGTTLAVESDGAIVASGANPTSEVYTLAAPVELAQITALRLELLPDEKLSGKGPGRSGNGNVVLTSIRAHAQRAGGTVPWKFKAAAADFSQQDYPVAAAIDEDPRSGWAIDPEVGKPHAALFELAQPAAVPGGTLIVSLHFESQFAHHQPGRFRLSVTDSAEPLRSRELPAEVAQAMAVSRDRRSDEQRRALVSYFRSHVSPPARALADEIAKLAQARADFEARLPTAMVMAELPQPRETFVLVRGQYDKRGQKVTAAVPAFLPPLPRGAPANRLGLAQWLVDPAHPLVARVTVNRYWQMLFGTGLVKTAEEFGSQGEPPSHPELLDWLAVEFREGTNLPHVAGRRDGWNVKGLLKLLVTSAAYRQSSAVSPALRGKDPENRLLARGARFRLPAELIRDQALAASGLLDDAIGGRSVSPYQPPGIWEELASREDGKNWTAQSYEQGHGRDLYRRTMYTFWKRTAPPPSLVTFDAPDREICTVRRSRTNTPLQALVLWNDPTYVEAARKLAERMLREGGGASAERIAWAFRLATARRPGPREVAVLERLYQDQLARFRADAAAARKLLAVGESPCDERLDAAELAAWTIVASAILNLDETVTKG